MTALQLDLFPVQTKPTPKPLPQPEVPLSHNSDSLTSFQAAEEFQKSGRLAKHQQLVLDGVRRCNGGTHSEIAEVIPELDWLQVARRLSELERLGWVKKGQPKICPIKRSRCVTWWLAVPEAGDGRE